MAARVKSEFKHAWDNYRRYAWGHDELKPLSRKPRDRISLTSIRPSRKRWVDNLWPAYSRPALARNGFRSPGGGLAGQPVP